MTIMADAFNREAFTLLGVGIVVIGVRTLARLKTVKSIRRFAMDDYLMLFAAVGEPPRIYLLFNPFLRRLRLNSQSYR